MCEDKTGVNDGGNNNNNGDILNMDNNNHNSVLVNGDDHGLTVNNENLGNTTDSGIISPSSTPEMRDEESTGGLPESSGGLPDSSGGLGDPSGVHSSSSSTSSSTSSAHNGDLAMLNHDKEDKKDSNLTNEDEDINQSNSNSTNKQPILGRTIQLAGSEEVVLIQDTSFTVKIIAPGCEPFDLQVSSMELVQEIHQVLMDREETCHRTCFSLQLDSQALDNFTELKNVEGLNDGAVLKIVEDPYTVREARIHLRHVRDLIKSIDSTDAYNGSECSSVSYLNVITNGNVQDRKKFKLENSIDCSPPEFCMPQTKERPLTCMMMPFSKESLNLQCLKVLSPSGWNPPPGNRKLHGDLLYLYVLTMEDKRYHITCCTKGFYVNESTEEEFNPRAANPKFVFHSLVELLSQISPIFKKNFTAIQKKRCQRHPFERVATPYQVYSWLAPTFEHVSDFIRAEDAFAFKLGYEEHIPGQTREWNEELQTTRELPRKTLPERLLRERAIFKVHSDFVAAATRGAMAVVDGNVMAINPGDDPKMQMFIWNNIFFSLGYDVKDHYKEFGGDAAAFVAPNNDLQGVKSYFNLDPEGLYMLGTVVVDYRGYRITAQSIIPGILERDQEQSVVYGSIDFGKTVVALDKYQELLKKPAQQLKLLPHKVKSVNGEIVTLHTSVESKGIVGNDSRHYILDLLRTFPPDVHYLADGEVNEVSKSNGYPRNHIHKFSCLRQELIDAFIEARYVMFIKIAACHLQKVRADKLAVENSTEHDQLSPTSEFVMVPKEGNEQQQQEKSDVTNPASLSSPASAPLSTNGTLETGPDVDSQLIADEIKRQIAARSDSPVGSDKDLPEADEAKKIMDSLDTENYSSAEDATKEIIRKAAIAVGSLSETEFDIRFNPDCYSSTVTLAEDEDSINKQKRLIRDAAQFLLTSQIPNFIRDCLDHTFLPLDGASLTESLHNRGINMRYLGKLTHLIDNIPLLQYLKTICLCELISRSAKHAFRSYLPNVEQSMLSSAVAHFMNCFLGSLPNPQPILADEMVLRNKRGAKKKKGSTNSLQQADSAEWAQMSPKSFWQIICKELDTYYGYNLECDSCDSFVEKTGVQKISILRRFCSIAGIQLLLREYALDNKQKAAFNEEDILNLFPIVKHINPRASDAYNFYTSGQAKIQQGQLRAGYDLVSEALNSLNNVYGAMHPEIAQCLRLLARLAYILGDHQEALTQQHKAVLMSERCNGLDHAQTILEYTHLALYSFANLQVSTALKLLYRARYLLLLANGENHPHMALLDSNIGLILHAVNEYDLSLKFFENALKLHQLYFGKQSLKTALTYHLIARTQSCRGDFRSALQYEKETFTIYKNTLGEDHEKTKESSECLKHLTHQAVTFQKRMNEITRNSGSVSQLLPLQIQQPSFSSVLDMLNVINGIVFIQISPKEVEALRAELEKGDQQAEQQANGEVDILPLD